MFIVRVKFLDLIVLLLVMFELSMFSSLKCFQYYCINILQKKGVKSHNFTGVKYKMDETSSDHHARAFYLPDTNNDVTGKRSYMENNNNSNKT